MDVMLVVAATAFAAAVGCGIALLRSRRRVLELRSLVQTERATADELRQRFGGVLDLEQELARARAAANEARTLAAAQTDSLNLDAERLRAQYAAGLKRYGELSAAVRGLEESLESIDVGLYRPHFNYSDSEGYKRAIEGVRHEQKALVKSGLAVTCGTTWTVGGSQRDGERMVKQTQKLILRAFNSEAEAAVANVAWNNHDVMTARLRRTFEALNGFGTVLSVRLTEEYLDAHLRELRLVFEAAEKKQAEKEDQRRQRAAQKEEERVQRELLREQERAADDEERHERLSSILSG